MVTVLASVDLSSPGVLAGANLLNKERKATGIRCSRGRLPLLRAAVTILPPCPHPPSGLLDPFGPFPSANTWSRPRRPDPRSSRASGRARPPPPPRPVTGVARCLPPAPHLPPAHHTAVFRVMRSGLCLPFGPFGLPRRAARILPPLARAVVHCPSMEAVRTVSGSSFSQPACPCPHYREPFVWY